MSKDRRDEIARLMFAVFAQHRPAKTHPVPYSRMVLALQHCSDISREEIDHVLVALCCRNTVNLIAGELFFCGPADLLVPEAVADPDRIDWVFAGGRYATG